MKPIKPHFNQGTERDFEAESKVCLGAFGSPPNVSCMKGPIRGQYALVCTPSKARKNTKCDMIHSSAVFFQCTQSHCYEERADFRRPLTSNAGDLSDHIYNPSRPLILDVLKIHPITPLQKKDPNFRQPAQTRACKKIKNCESLCCFTLSTNLHVQHKKVPFSVNNFQ